MAHYFQKAEKDATIIKGNLDTHSTGSFKNHGMDEILVIGKTFQKDSSIAVQDIQRSLIKFPITTISSSIADGTIPADAKFYLNLKDAGSQELNRDQVLHINAISQSWVEGDGKTSDTPPTTNGVSWKFRDERSGSVWHTNEDLYSGATYFSGSNHTSSISVGKDNDIDVRADVTEIVKQWYSGSIANEGFLIRRSATDEASVEKLGTHKFFSSDTHTIFAPTLEVEWDDSSWSTGSLSALSSNELNKLKIYTENFSREYKVGSLSKIIVKGREKYPTKTFATSSEYLTVKYLPSGSSFYTVLDAVTDDVIIPYGIGSKISCDTTSNFFNLRTDGLEPERFYRLRVKIEEGTGINKKVNFYDVGEFKVVR